MISAILIDDEPIILNSLKTNCHWQDLGVEIIATAEDGEEAFEKICDLMPDLVITDIKMPGMDGIELIKLLNTANIFPKVIFATGHSDYEYTREAIRLGAYDYLLKPFSPTELEDAVKKCVQTIQAAKANMDDQDRKVGELQLQHYFSTPSRSKRQSLRQALNDYLDKIYSIDKLAVNLLATELSPETSPTGVSFDDCLQLIRRLNYTLGLKSYFAFSLSDQDLLVIISYRTADSTRSTDFSKANINYMASLQETLLENLGVDASVHCLEPLLCGEGKSADAENLYLQFAECLDDLREPAAAPEALDSTQTKKYVQDALAYIHDHYGSQIKVQQVAEHVYLSESHFSTLFSKHVGMSFSKYLAKYRIDKAKTYMQKNPYAKIYEVAVHVGYSDARYFSTLFKKTEGLTPTEYMNKLF